MIKNLNCIKIIANKQIIAIKWDYSEYDNQLYFNLDCQVEYAVLQTRKRTMKA